MASTDKPIKEFDLNGDHLSFKIPP